MYKALGSILRAVTTNKRNIVDSFVVYEHEESTLVPRSWDNELPQIVTEGI